MKHSILKFLFSALQYIFMLGNYVKSWLPLFLPETV